MRWVEGPVKDIQGNIRHYSKGTIWIAVPRGEGLG